MSRDQRSPSPLRCGLVGSAAAAAAAVTALVVGPDVRTASRAVGSGAWQRASFEQLLVWLASGVLLTCVAWLAVVTGLVALTAARGRTAAGVPGCPSALRRAVLVACGAGLAAGLAAPVHAETAHVGAVARPVFTASSSAGPTTGAATLRGLSLPDRSEGSLARPRRAEPAPGDRLRPAPADDVVVVCVRPGDTLWSIAAASLPAGAGDAAVTARWHLIHTENLAVIGANADLILPTTELRVPRR